MKIMKSVLSILSIALMVCAFTGCMSSDESKCADGDLSACAKVGNKVLKDMGY